MAQYVFTCCGRTVNVPSISSATASLQHLCLNDVPCIGIANLVTNAQAAVAADVATLAVDPVTGAVDGTDNGTPMNGDGQ